MPIADNIRRIQKRIADSGPPTITLMAVSKTFPAAMIRQAYEAGLRVFGESRIQEFAAKADLLTGLHEASWHLIGHLQTNKALKAAELFGAVDSVDSLRLAEKLNAAALQHGKKLPVLIEINIGGEAAKHGLSPASPELQAMLQKAGSWSALEISGLMTVPPFSDDPEGSRPYFRQMRELRDRIAQQAFPNVAMDVLSMGMSHDFEVAIEEGSTCVRIGTAIFGDRDLL